MNTNVGRELLCDMGGYTRRRLFLNGEGQKGKSSHSTYSSIVSPFAVEMAVSFPFCFALRRLAELLQPIVKRPAL